MLFNSFEFCFIFFPLVTGFYFLLPHRWRWLLLLTASCWFYMAFVPVYILILAFTIGVDLAAGILIVRSQGARRKAWLLASIVANVGVLAVFKYYAFLTANIEYLVHALGATGYDVPDLGILLPIGLSFHTFQSLSYTIEVYRGHQAAERNPGVFALYVMFYPQLVAGPIERPGNLLRQLNAADGQGIRSRLEYDRIVRGLKQMLWGFFKKLVIADRCAQVVDLVYADPGAYDGWSTLLATYCFALQIYCDFSGYTDIALGAARVMGFDLMVNFRTPYRSASISEFWSRWHISLSSWFRDYLYIPLGGNRVAKGRWYLNLMIVFLVSGLWHGANWTFVVWGSLHGTYLVLALVFARSLARFNALTGLDGMPRSRRALNVLVTVHLVVLAWVFFRAKDLGDAWTVLSHWIGVDRGGYGVAHVAGELKPVWLAITLAAAILFLAIDPVVDSWIKGERRGPSRAMSYAFHAALLTACLLFGFYGKTMFIYFQF
jgi:D-alanyl-lipoteichoic acid acyltransferase DltB (MBOAT superfamily)